MSITCSGKQYRCVDNKRYNERKRTKYFWTRSRDNRETDRPHDFERGEAYFQGEQSIYSYKTRHLISNYDKLNIPTFWITSD